MKNLNCLISGAHHMDDFVEASFYFRSFKLWFFLFSYMFDDVSSYFSGLYYFFITSNLLKEIKENQDLQ